MPFVKDSMSLLIESSEADLLSNTKSVVAESTIRSGYSNIEEASEEIVYAPEMVTVVKVGNEFFTEMNFLYPYMKTNDISSIAEALNNVAAANNMPDNSIGLLIESDCDVEQCICKAVESCNQKKKDGVLNKISKAIGLTKSLKGKGINVKKKKSCKKNKSCK